MKKDSFTIEAFVCLDCKSEFEVLAGEKAECLACGGCHTKEVKNLRLNCEECCSGCEVKDVCLDRS